MLKFLKLDGLSEHLSGYVEDKIALLKLELQEDAASAGAKVLILSIMLVFGLCSLLFASIGVAILLNKVLDHTYTGYLLMAGMYLILTLIAFSLKDNDIIKNTLYKVINKSFDRSK